MESDPVTSQMHAQADSSGATTPPAPEQHRLRRRLLVVGTILGLLLLGWLLTPKGGTRAPSGRFASGGGPVPVVAAAARGGNMQIILNGLGTVTPLATVVVQSQINGQITQIAFKEGQTVKRGDFLIQIDPRPYQVALEQAQGALARDKSLLANARIDLTRYQTLWSQDSIAEQQLATQRSLVAQDEGNVKTDQAQIDAAKLNLVYCHIISPIDGRVGLQQINVGNYVTPAEPNGLVVLTQLQPITVVFPLPEDTIQPVLDELHNGHHPSVKAYDRNHTEALSSGVLQTIDNQIDVTTGTVKLKALFANTDDRLFPNQFVNVDLLLNTLENAIVIPQAAVQRGAPGTYVYVVGPNHTVSVRKVTLGPGDAHNVTISAGLKTGENVVVDGADRLKDGAKVTLRPPTGSGAAGQRRQPGNKNTAGANASPKSDSH